MEEFLREVVDHEYPGITHEGTKRVFPILRVN